MTDLILLPTDGSDAAEQAADRALELAAEREAAIHALYIVDTNRVGNPALCSTELLITEYEDNGRELLEDLKRRGAERGVDVEARVCRGEPLDEIKKAVREREPDLTVFGFGDDKSKMMSHSMRDKMVQEFEQVVLH
ncbi:universal stress protein [Halococcoides cellulosivorans]|uniref:Universal stress protein n=1 Tax=Halococcoides cellulosivorans TaxID=1679096 RepID=A0A2R4WZR6_9EURY|nr:universal stress protein [Halococcoides cellulosivorans]AWB27017.1 universal stress protein [Halococcoides cellulosivorans]